MPEDFEMQQQAQAGRDAREVLEHPSFIAACDRVAKDLYDEWRTSAIEDVAKREGAYYTTQALERVRRELARVSDSGVMATAKLRQKGIRK